MSRSKCYSSRVVKLFAICLIFLASASCSSATRVARFLPQDDDEDDKKNDKNKDKEDEKDKNDKEKEDDKDEVVIDSLIEEVKTQKPTRSPTGSPTITAGPTVSPYPSTLPSSSPTSSSAPSASPSVSPSSTPTSSSAPSAAPIPYYRPTRVDMRYVPWWDLPEDIRTTASLLNYTKGTWEDYNSNPIESLNWDRLSRTEKMYAGILGFEKLSWDCWQNHFQSLRWIDLDNEGIQSRQWWEDLGWDISSWNKYDDPPDSNDLYWYFLSEEERFAAAQLCYFKRTWDETNVYIDGFPLDKPEDERYTNWFELDSSTRSMAENGLKYNALLWNVVGLHPVESRDWRQLTPLERSSAKLLDWDQISWDCWVNHFRAYTWEELVLWGLDFHYTALGWTDKSWAGLEDEPEKKTWKELNEAERTAATELCFFRQTWEGYDMTKNNGPHPFAKPKQRYIRWGDLPEDIKSIANGTLGYTEETWNNLGSYKLETKGWNGLTDEQQADAIKLGFYKDTWDCFLSHYNSYEWNDLTSDQQDVFRLLGWSEASWLYKETPASYDKKWNQLSATEQSVANAICYFEHNWDKNTLDEVIVEFAPIGIPSNPTNQLDVSAVSGVLNGEVKNSAVSFSCSFTTSLMALVAMAYVILM